MPIISPESGYLTVVNLFLTDTAENQERLLGAMREIVDTAAYPGWISSTVHAGQDRFGTANYIQWRSGEDLEARYAGDEFNHRTLPLFGEITTSMKLLQNEVVFTQLRSGAATATEISPGRDDYTVIEFLGVAAENQDDLVDAVGPAQDWLPTTPGYRSHSVLRGLGSRNVEGSFVVTYSQWDSKELYDAYRALPADVRPAARQKVRARLEALVLTSEENTYRVVHSRSAGSPSLTEAHAG